MCRKLEISRSSYYYLVKEKKSEAVIEQAVIEEFHLSRNNYGTRRLKVMLQQRGLQVSRRKIGRIMKKFHLVSNYTKAYYKRQKSVSNQKMIENKVNQEFDSRKPMEVLVTDLTYVKVERKWHYICLVLDLFNREIVGYSSGPNKDAKLVQQALSTVKHSMKNTAIFHTDRGKEFDNETIDQILDFYEIDRSLSKPSCPYDNAVAESTYKSVKIEFVYQEFFENLLELQYKLMDYVNWWNHLRIHSTLDYQTPVAYRLNYNLDEDE